MPSPPDGCLFCRLVADGEHVHAGDGFVAIRDINPIAETHLLVLPARHVDTFRDVEAFPDEEAGRMLRFVAETAASAGLDDYKVLVNVGAGGGQTISLGSTASVIVGRRFPSPWIGAPSSLHDKVGQRSRAAV